MFPRSSIILWMNTEGRLLIAFCSFSFGRLADRTPYHLVTYLRSCTGQQGPRRTRLQVRGSRVVTGITASQTRANCPRYRQLDEYGFNISHQLMVHVRYSSHASHGGVACTRCSCTALSKYYPKTTVATLPASRGAHPPWKRESEDS